MIKPGLRKRLGLEMFRRLRHDAVQAHRLDTLFWECTLRCNLSCRHCGSDCRNLPATDDMPAEDFLRVVDSLTPHVDPHRTFIIFTGGEALMRRDLEACGKALYDRGFPWGVVTNGMLLDARRLDSLLCAGMHALTISLDGFESDHNWLRGSPKSFARASAALPLLAASDGLAWDVVTCATPRNFGRLGEFRDFLISCGVREWRVFTVFPSGRAAGDDGLRLTDAQFVGLMEFLKDTRKEGHIKASYGCEGFLGSYETEVRDKFFMCRAGVSVASVLSDGSISGCASIRAGFHQGNIYRDDFWDVWSNRFGRYRNREWCRTGLCGSCEMFRYCEGGGMHLRDDSGGITVCHYERLGSGRSER